MKNNEAFKIELKGKGVSLREIAEELGYCSSYVRELCCRSFKPERETQMRDALARVLVKREAEAVSLVD